ncbi:hypothetical protein TIFTF001_006688 [Ficus carica]|uniref:Acyl-[acyl-carrier-protein] hydrolase n=1 Tax=Ficus carica TaxID=3494 RepID=A0AA88DFX6_FICCA|nr:hypothetical protein TIFTF001_006688 [Ficus carica]
MELHLAAPRSLILNKKDICLCPRISNSGDKQNLDHTNRLKFKASVAADHLINSKGIELYIESTLNHLKSAGIAMEGFGSTMEMSRRNLIWVAYRMQIVVDDHPSWGDVVQVETWTCASGKNEIRRDWLVRDYTSTGKTLLRAVSLNGPIWMSINMLIMSNILIRFSSSKVNNKSAPDSVMETHKLRAMRLEFRKECEKKSSLQSLGALASKTDDGVLELDHTLRLVENESEILRARPVWMPRKFVIR